jgi:hypothetical protein
MLAVGGGGSDKGSVAVENSMESLRFDRMDRDYAAVLRSKTPSERAWMINDCWRTARAFVAAGERMRHPDWTEEQIQKAVSQRLLHGAK